MGWAFSAALALGLLMLVTVNVIRYEQVERCDAEIGTEQWCLEAVPGAISKVGDEREKTTCHGPFGGCTSSTFYDILVSLDEGGDQVELTFNVRFPPPGTAGDRVTVERWRGRYLTLARGDQKLSVVGWTPGLTKWLVVLIWLLVAVAVIATAAPTLASDRESRAVRATRTMGRAAIWIAAGLLTLFVATMIGSPDPDSLYLNW